MRVPPASCRQHRPHSKPTHHLRLAVAILLSTPFSGCSWLPVAITDGQPAKMDDSPVLFAHSDPTPHHLPAVSSNAWSPTPWPPQLPAAEPVRAPRSARDEAPAEAVADLTVFFDNDADVLTSAEAARLARFFDSLPQPLAARYVLAGHTDSNHSAAYNQGLSQRRTLTVARWLAARGVPEAQLRLTAFGLTQPQADNQTEQGRALNRRVRIDVHAPAR